MTHRHEDDLPPLTAAQRAEVLRLAVRLQEEEAEGRAFLLAAEEAGIERRFLEEAVGRVASGVRPTRVRHGRGGTLWALIGTLLASVVAVQFFAASPARGAILAVGFLVTLLFALPPCSLGRSRRQASSLVFGAWIVADLVFLAYLLQQGPWGDFEWESFFAGLGIVLAVQAILSVAGVEAARQAYRLSARLVRRRPQFLP